MNHAVSRMSQLKENGLNFQIHSLCVCVCVYVYSELSHILISPLNFASLITIPAVTVSVIKLMRFRDKE